MLSSLLLEGIEILQKQPVASWWNITEDTSGPRAPIGLSELTACSRKLWLKKHNEPETNSSLLEMQITWWIGHFLENLAIRALEAAGCPVLHRQETIYWEGIPGHTDGGIYTDSHPLLVEHYGPGKLLILELKSTTEQKIKTAIRRGSAETAFPEYYGQTQAYMIAWEKTFNKTPDGAVLLMINKATAYPGGVPTLPFYEELIEPNSFEAEGRMSYLQSLFASAELPPIPYTDMQGQIKKAPLCNFCPFEDFCWKNKKMNDA